MVINAIDQNVLLDAKTIRRLSDRHTGIGFDQCLIVSESHNRQVDFQYRIFNADGNEVGQCGNGARCLALFIHQEGLSQKNKVTVQTNTSVLSLKMMDNGNVLVEMDEPKLEPKDIPLRTPHKADYYPFIVDDETYYLHAINVGNPHGILVVPKVTHEMVEKLGLKLSQHPLFNEGANISFMEIEDPGNIRLRVFERGVGETKACGSAAVASSIAAMLFHEGNQQISVHLPGGQLNVNWPGFGHSVTFSGPAKEVYQGTITL